MGAEPWDYWVPYQQSIQQALDDLREQVFRSGGYRGSNLKPATPEEAVENMEADGTASILDITSVSDEPEFCAVCPLSEEQLRDFFDTTQPTREQIEHNLEFFENIERGHGVYIIAFQDGKPSEIFFGGYSFD